MTGSEYLDSIMDQLRIEAEQSRDRPLYAATFLQVAIDISCDEQGVEETQRWLREAADALPHERPGKGH